MNFGETLKRLRIQKNKTQLEISKILGVNFQTIYKYEKNIVVPPADTLVKLADYFEVTIDYLLGHSDNNSSMQIAASTKNEIDLSEICDEDKETLINIYNMMKNKKKGDS